MTDTTYHMSISLDGFVAGPDQSREDPLGKRGIELHRWHLGDERANDADETASRWLMRQRRAYVMGRNMFDRGELRLIDFGDCGWGHYLYDLVVTLSELEDSPRLDQLRSALLSGYRAERDLSAEHEAMIDSFVLLRELQNLTWFVTAREDPNYSARATKIAGAMPAWSDD